MHYQEQHLNHIFLDPEWILYFHSCQDINSQIPYKQVQGLNNTLVGFHEQSTYDGHQCIFMINSEQPTSQKYVDIMQRELPESKFPENIQNEVNCSSSSAYYKIESSL